jgi:hypothetical protein
MQAFNSNAENMPWKHFHSVRNSRGLGTTLLCHRGVAPHILAKHHRLNICGGLVPAGRFVVVAIDIC